MENLLKKYCKKSDKKMYFDLHKKRDVYHHEKSNLYMILSEDKKYISINTCKDFNVISNSDWLFSFTDENIFILFITSLELNFADDV